MVYRAIGLMSGSSLDGLDIVLAEFTEQAGKWSWEIKAAACYPYEEALAIRLKDAVHLPALDYQLLHTEYGHYLGQQVNRFIEENQLHFQAALIASHGHTSFHLPGKKMTAQLGDGAAIAAETGLPVVSDLRALDVALGGQGAPIVPIGEKFLFPGYGFFLNIGGIANLSVSHPHFAAFDICAANRVLNMLAMDAGKPFDHNGQIAASGQLDHSLLEKLDALDYYQQPAPKSLANDFGTDRVYPMIRAAGISIPDAMRTYATHIARQTGKAVAAWKQKMESGADGRCLVTGGGAFNSYLISLIAEALNESGIQTEVPDENLINYKEALVMAFIGVLRWRQEFNVLATVTGASRNSIGGALWTGQDA